MCPHAGRVGLWKDVFTVSMNDKFDTVYRQKMGKSDLTFDFGVWGAPSPLQIPFHHFPIHISPSRQLTCAQVHTNAILTSKKKTKNVNSTVWHWGYSKKTSQNAIRVKSTTHHRFYPRGLNPDLTGNHTNTLINSWSNPPSTPTSTVCSHCCVCICVYINQVWIVVGFSGPDP